MRFPASSSTNSASNYNKPNRAFRIFGWCATVMLFLVAISLISLTGLIPSPFNESFSRPANLFTVKVICPDKNSNTLPLNKLQVNVFNSTGQSALAKKVADQLTAKQVTVNTVGNWPAHYKESARIFAQPEQVDAAYTLAAAIPGSIVSLHPKNNYSDIIDLVIGDKFSTLHDLDSLVKGGQEIRTPDTCNGAKNTDE